MSSVRSLWIHGWATDSRVFRPVLDRLDSPLAAAATAVDLPGYSPESGPGDMPESSSWLKQEIESIAGGKSLVLIGWSLGAMLALEAAAALPDRVTALVLISGCARFVSSEQNSYGRDPRVLQAMIHRLRRSGPAVVSAFLAGMFSPAEKEYARAFLDGPGKCYLDFLPTGLDDGLNYLLTSDLEHCLAGIACPALVIHGSGDTVVDLRLGERLADLLPASRLLVLDGAGHAPLLTRSDECAARIGEFIVSCGER